MAKLKNKKLFYKIGISTGATVAIVAPLATLVSCGLPGSSSSSKYGTTWQFSSHREIQNVVAAENEIGDKLGKQQFIAPIELASIDSIGQETMNSAILNPFRVVKYKNDKIVLDSSNAVKSVEAHRDSIVRFTMIKAVEVTFGDGSTKNYTNDAADQAEAGKYVATFGAAPTAVNFEDSINYRDDVNDVNSDIDLIKQIRAKGINKISYVFKDDLQNHKWMNQLGGRSNSSIKPEDYSQGILVSSYKSDKAQLSDSNLSSGSFSKLVDAFNADTSLFEKNPFSAPTSSSTESQFVRYKSQYGLDVSNIFNNIDSLDKSIVNGKLDFDFSLSKTNNIPSDSIADFVNINIIQKPLAGAISVEEVARLKAKYDQTILDALKPVLTPSEISSFKDSKFFKSGYIQLKAAQRNEHMWAGQYYISASESKLLTFSQNDDFVDQRWNNIKNSNGDLATVKTMRYKFIQRGPQEGLNIINEYKAGTASLAKFANLSTSEKQNALQDSSNWGIKFKMDYNDSTVPYASYTGQMLLPGSPTDKDLLVYFNSNFAKLNWGRTIQEIKSDTKANENGELIKNIFAGKGFVFRKNFDAAINAYTAVQQAFNGRWFGWNSMLAPDGIVPGADAHSTPGEFIKKFFDEYDANNLNHTNNTTADQMPLAHVFNMNLPKLQSSNTLSFDAPVTYRDYINGSVNPNANILGPSLEKQLLIRQNIKDALDAANIPVGEKVTWEIPYGRGQTSPEQNKVLSDLIIYIRSLDSRLNPVAKIDPVKESEDATNLKTLVDLPDAKFTMNGTAADQTKPWTARIRTREEGYNAASINYVRPYSFNSPASALFDDMGYLQSGVFLGLSYYASSEGENIAKGTILENLKPVTDSIKEATTAVISDLTKAGKFTSSFAPAIIQSIKSLKFDEIYKSNFIAINDFDYLGFKGFENIQNEKKRIDNLQTKTPEDNLRLKDFDNLQNSLDAIFQNSPRILDSKMKTYTLEQNAKIIEAFMTIMPGNWNPLATNVKARTVPSISLLKDFLSIGSPNRAGYEYLSEYRVDLDKQNWNVIEPAETLY